MTSAGYECVKIESAAPVAVLRMHRPERRNALSRQMIVELASAVRAADAEPDLAGILICGSESVFSAGADLTEAVRINDPWEFDRYNRLFRQLTDAIEDAGKPVLAVISGHCLTGGLELALACDWRVAAPGSTFAITSARIGSMAGFGGTQRLPRTVGMSQAKRMLFAAETIDADEALRIGLIDVLVPAGELETYAHSQVRLYATRGPLSLASAKRAVDIGMRMELAAALDYEAAVGAPVFASADKKEGMSAFLEKREPRFQGR